MKTQIRIASLSLLTLLYLTLTVVPAVGSNITLYSNGPASPNDTYAWSDAQAISNSFYIGSPSGATITGFSIAVWVPTGDRPLAAEFYIGTSPFGQEITGIGTYFSNQFLFQNFNDPTLCGSASGGSCDVYRVTSTLSQPISLPQGTYWLELGVGFTVGGAGLLWDQNDNGIPGSHGGVGCTGWLGSGSPCPSLAYGYSSGQIPSEDPDILGYVNGTTPEPGTILLFGSGILGLGGVLRRRLMG